MLRIVLCDNDPEDLRSYEEKIRGAVADLIPDFEIITYRTPESLLFAIDDIRDLADVMVLDIRMPRTDGIELAKKLRKAGYKNDIIFLTQSEDDMLRAFDVGALNYIVKGKTSRERAAFVIRQAIRSSLEKRSRNLLLEIGGEIRSIPVEDILYIEVRDHLILVHLEKGGLFSFNSTMNRLEEKLRSYGLIRVHRSFLVPLRRVSSLDSSEVVLDSGDRVPVSRGRYKDVKKRIKATEGDR